MQNLLNYHRKSIRYEHCRIDGNNYGRYNPLVIIYVRNITFVYYRLQLWDQAQKNSLFKRGRHIHSFHSTSLASRRYDSSSPKLQSLPFLELALHQSNAHKLLIFWCILVNQKYYCRESDVDSKDYSSKCLGHAVGVQKAMGILKHDVFI